MESLHNNLHNNLEREIKRYVESEVKKAFKHNVNIIISEDQIVNSFLQDKGKHLEEKIREDTLKMISQVAVEKIEMISQVAVEKIKGGVTDYVKANIQKLFTEYVEENKWVKEFIASHIEQIKETVQEKIKDIVESDEKTSPIIQAQVAIIDKKAERIINNVSDTVANMVQDVSVKLSDMVKEYKSNIEDLKEKVCALKDKNDKLEKQYEKLKIQTDKGEKILSGVEGAIRCHRESLCYVFDHINKNERHITKLAIATILVGVALGLYGMFDIARRRR